MGNAASDLIKSYEEYVAYCLRHGHSPVSQSDYLSTAYDDYVAARRRRVRARLDAQWHRDHPEGHTGGTDV